MDRKEVLAWVLISISSISNKILLFELILFGPAKLKVDRKRLERFDVRRIDDAFKRLLAL